MSYFKNTHDGYILAIGTGGGREEITEAEYDEIMAVIDARPTPPDGYDYRLKDDLTWEQYEVELTPEPDESDKAAAYDILVGEAE